jgi:hypothetical protein
MNDALGLDLGTQLVGQLADPQQLAQKHSHVQSP